MKVLFAFLIIEIMQVCHRLIQMRSHLNRFYEGATGNRIANINFFAETVTFTREKNHVVLQMYICKGEKLLRSLKQIKKTDEDVAKPLQW